MRLLLIVLFLFETISSKAQHLQTVFESSGGKKTPTYEEAITWWKGADAASPIVKMMEMGPTDAGFPLHLIMISGDGVFDIATLKKKKRNIIFVNNGIHPGEPDGIDASMLLAKEIISKKYVLPTNVVLAIIPVYNIGGMLNRSAHYRVDQNGPEEFGFRGNSQNLDLNRDFIKADSKEAFTFSKIFQFLDPDIFVDNHVSNGADYQHVITLITSQHNRLGGALGQFLNNSFEPALYKSMKEKGWDLVPYVNHFEETPDKGWPQFWDSPRYSSGYASLWNTFAFIPETHMLKAYDKRVLATKDLMKSFILFAGTNGSKIAALRAEAKKEQRTAPSFPIAWKWDATSSTEILFKGYQAGKRASEISGLPRLFYDRTKPFEKKVPFYNTYKDTLSVVKPSAYVIPQGWWKIIERLQANGITMRRLPADTSINVEAYKISSYNSSARPFEGHHLNNNVQVTKSNKTILFKKGDYFISLNQKGNRFLINVLEPQGEDSYFAWNFFDAILGQKEGFSDYVFEETATTYLQQHPEIKKALEERKAKDSVFAKNGAAQLAFVYQNSTYYEEAHLQYPVYRVL